MKRRPMRAVIRAYRKSGRMFAQSMHTDSDWGTGYRPSPRDCETGYVVCWYSDPCPCGRTFEQHPETRTEDRKPRLAERPVPSYGAGQLCVYRAFRHENPHATNYGPVNLAVSLNSFHYALCTPCSSAHAAAGRPGGYPDGTSRSRTYWDGCRR